MKLVHMAVYTNDFTLNTADCTSEFREVVLTEFPVVKKKSR